MTVSNRSNRFKSSQLVSDIFAGADSSSGHGHLTSSNQWESGSETVRMRNGFPINTFQNFNISLFENDPEFYDFVRSVIPRPQLKSFNSNFPGSDSKSKPAIRKYMTLKQMIMFFQKTPVFGKFSFYGCWCFPDGASDILSGYGEPVDNIDKTCKRLNQCYKCATMRYGKGECPSNTKYQFQGLEDQVTGQRYVECLDEEGSCPRSLCECDKKMASGLASLESEWEEGYHSKWSKNLEVAFDRESTCRTNLNGFNWARSMHGGGGGGGSNGGADACCGEEGEKFPYNTNGGRRGCCEGRTYSTELMKCCPQDGVKSLDSKCS